MSRQWERNRRELCGGRRPSERRLTKKNQPATRRIARAGRFASRRYRPNLQGADEQLGYDHNYSSTEIETPVGNWKTGFCFMSRPLIAVLTGIALVAIAGARSKYAPGSPRGLLEHFCELDAKGTQLTSEGWKQIAELFTNPKVPPRKTVVVIRDFVVSRPSLKDTRAEFYVEYVQLGKIDPSHARFSHVLPLKVRAEFFVVMMERPNSKSPGQNDQSVGSPNWQIEGAPPEPHLTTDSAIAYLTSLRDEAPDPSTRKNAERGISALRRLQSSSAN